MDIFKVEGVVTPKDDKTNIYHEFKVPSGLSKLVIKYKYGPKLLENEEEARKLTKDKLDFYIGDSSNVDKFLPVKNLITLSLDENGNYVGAAHRQANDQEHTISKEFSSPGFYKTDIREGTWRIALNVHCCACNVNYEIAISGGEE